MPSFSTPFEHCGGQGGGHTRLVVRIVWLSGDFVVLPTLRGNLHGYGRACHAVDGDQCGAAEGDVHSGVQKGGIERPGEGQAARCPCGLRSFPWDKACGLNRRERGNEQVNARTAFGGMEIEADLGIGVVGNLRASVRIPGRVGFPSGHDSDPACGEQGAQPDAEGQRRGFFRLTAGETAAKVGAAVGRIEDYHKSGCGGGEGSAAPRLVELPSWPLKVTQSPEPRAGTGSSSYSSA